MGASIKITSITTTILMNIIKKYCIDVGFIGDLHLGHLNESIRRGFSSSEDFIEEFIKKYNSVTGKHSLVFLLGDITMETNKFYDVLDRLNGRKRVILGNHDQSKHVNDLLKHVESVCGIMEYKGAVLTHIPIHETQIERYKFNIHAHMHSENVMFWKHDANDRSNTPYTAKQLIDPRYRNVSWQMIDGVPISFNELIKPNYQDEGNKQSKPQRIYSNNAGAQIGAKKVEQEQEASPQISVRTESERSNTTRPRLVKIKKSVSSVQ